jgi:hypothetical protein
MKKHFISLFTPDKLRKTVILLVIAALLIAISLMIGITDNLPMIAMLLAGMIFLCFAVLHPWEKASSFAILTAVCFVILSLDFIWPFINEGIAMTMRFGCFAGIITGIIGIFTRLKSWKRLPYAGSLLSLVALGIFITSLNIPLKEIIDPGNVWILIGTQLFITVLLFFIGLLNKKESRLTKALLIVAGIVLIVLSIWGFYASTWQFGPAAHSKIFVVLMTRIYASIEIIVAALSLFACK